MLYIISTVVTDALCNCTIQLCRLDPVHHIPTAIDYENVVRNRSGDVKLIQFTLLLRGHLDGIQPVQRPECLRVRSPFNNQRRHCVQLALSDHGHHQ